MSTYRRPNDNKANLLIHSYVDDVMEGVMKELGIPIPDYCPDFYNAITSQLTDVESDKKRKYESGDDGNGIDDVKRKPKIVGKLEPINLASENEPSTINNSENKDTHCNGVKEESDEKPEITDIKPDAVSLLNNLSDMNSDSPIIIRLKLKKFQPPSFTIFIFTCNCRIRF